MVKLQYPKVGYFTDRQRDERYEGPGEFNVPSEAVDQYLSRGWEEVEDSSEDDEDEPDEDEDEAVVDADEIEGDAPPVTHDREELENMSYNELRKMAADADRDDIDGRATKVDIIEAFEE